MKYIMTMVPIEVLNKLKRNEIVKPITDYSNPERTFAYKFLSKCSGWKNFFFGMDESTLETYESGLPHAKTYCDSEKVLLHLEIPEKYTYACLLYDFGELIYVTGLDIDHEIANWDMERIENSVLTGGADDNAIQYVYPVIKPNWLKSYEIIKKDPNYEFSK